MRRYRSSNRTFIFRSGLFMSSLIVFTECPVLPLLIFLTGFSSRTVTVTLTNVYTNSKKLYIHGLRVWSIRITDDLV